MWIHRTLFAAGIAVAMTAGQAVWAEGSHSHAHHQSVQAQVGSQVPKVRIEVTEDAASGWNVRIDTTDFRFTPENANGAHVPLEGHAHLFVDGEQVARLYGPWFHLGALPPGERRIMVTLNANDHRVYAVGSTPVHHEVTVSVPEPSS